MRQQISQPSFSRRLRGLVLFALLLLTAAVPGRACAGRVASPDGRERVQVAADLSTAPRPVLAGWFNIGPTKRSRVVQIGALGMCLALFIIFRSAKY